MNIYDLDGLYVGYNAFEKFSILIAADSPENAEKLAEEYRLEVGLRGSFTVSCYAEKHQDMQFDCDYIIK